MTALLLIAWTLSSLTAGIVIGLILGIRHGYHKAYLRYSNSPDALLWRARQLTH